MTTQQSTQLGDALNNYNAKKADYEAKVNAYNNILALPPSPANGAAKGGAKRAMDTAKAAMDTALNDYNTLKADIAAQEQAAFIAANPTVAVDIATAQANASVMAQIEVAKAKAAAEKAAAEVAAKAELEKQTATFAAQNKKAILYVAIGLVAVIIIGYAFLKFKKKLQP